MLKFSQVVAHIKAKSRDYQYLVAWSAKNGVSSPKCPEN